MKAAGKLAFGSRAGIAGVVVAAGLGDRHHQLGLAPVDGGHVGREQRPGRPGEQVVGLLRLEAGGQRPGHPDGVGGPLQGRLLALEAPQLTRANSVARVIRRRRMSSWPPTSLSVYSPRAPAMTRVTKRCR